MTGDFTWTNAIALAGVLLAYAGAIGGIWRSASKAIKDNQTASNREIKYLEKQLNDFKIKVTEEYASWDTVRSIETRLTERMDTISEQMMKMPDAIVDRLLKYMSFPSKP